MNSRAEARSPDASYQSPLLIDTRTASVSTDIDALRDMHRWPRLKAVGKVHRVRETAEKITTETAYNLLSTPLSPERFNEVVRSHWGVENSLHWRLNSTS